MPAKISNIHDKFIKQLLSNKELAIEFLQEYLPKELVDVLHFETLEVQDTSYVTDSLKTSYSDLLWRIRMKNRESLQLSLLLEHKSSPDQKTAFQLLEYLALAYQKQLREKKKPELIVPVLYYHGKQNWNFKTIEAHFNAYPEYPKKYLPIFSTEFVNLRKIEPEHILALKNGLLSSAVMLQKYCFDPEVLAIHIHTIVENLNPYLDSNIIDAIFVYIIHGTRLDAAHFTESIKKLPVDMSTKTMTLYDQLILKGKQEEMEKTILNAYDAGIDIATIRIITGEDEGKIKNILVQKNRIR